LVVDVKTIELRNRGNDSANHRVASVGLILFTAQPGMSNLTRILPEMVNDDMID
jgi:hypothetical protein